MVTKRLGLEWRHQERPFDDYSLQQLLPLKLSQLGPGLAWGDADGDGFDDLFVGGAAGQPGELFLYRGREGFERRTGPWSEHAESEDMATLWLDSDGDGDLDLFVSSGSNEYPSGDPRQADRLYRNDGSGTSPRRGASETPSRRGASETPSRRGASETPSRRGASETPSRRGASETPSRRGASLTFTHVPDALPEDHGFSGASAAADFDFDGDLDLFVGGRAVPGRYPTAPRSRLLRNDGGRFSDVTATIAPGLADVGMVTSALVERCQRRRQA